MKKIPLRQCIGCGEMKNKRELIRVLKGTDDVISIDATGRKNGRGAYICPSMACFEKAVKSRGLFDDMDFGEEGFEGEYEKDVEPAEDGTPAEEASEAQAETEE